MCAYIYQCVRVRPFTCVVSVEVIRTEALLPTKFAVVCATPNKKGAVFVDDKSRAQRVQEVVDHNTIAIAMPQVRVRVRVRVRLGLGLGLGL